MTHSDILLLIEHENSGEQVISSHSKYVWNNLKNRVTIDVQALELSKIMRKHLHNVLSLFALIASSSHQKFLLQFLHPEYAYFDYRFENFDPLDLSILTTNKKPLDSLNKQKNAERYVRVSFEALQDYQSKENRNVKEFKDAGTSKAIEELIALLNNQKYEEGVEKLQVVLESLSIQAMKDASF